jgi:hypothetical protein
MIDEDEDFVNPFPSEETLYAGRLDLRTRVRDTEPDPKPEIKKEVEPVTKKGTKIIPAGPPIFSEPEPEVEEAPPDKFWEESDKLDDTCRKPVELPASPKNKKKNHARRERREATRKRLAQEKTKEEERQERLRVRAGKRKQRSLTPKLPRNIFPEDPFRVQLQNGHWRLLRCSDMKNYVIRHYSKKIRRVWVQPCWLGKSSPRKFLKQQEKRDVLQFMRCAIKVRTEEERDIVQEFIDNPYFRRPQQLPSGRVTPEVAIGWRVEDSIESSKVKKQWSSVSDRSI